eukprot:2707405-Prymnesium_polylepis.1
MHGSPSTAVALRRPPGAADRQPNHGMRRPSCRPRRGRRGPTRRTEIEIRSMENRNTVPGAQRGRGGAGG